MTTVKHNKKRNTAFLYKVLLMEASKALVEKRDVYRKKVVKFLKENFASNTELGKELYLYKQVLDEQEVPPRLAKNYVKQICEQHERINKKKLFDQQTKVINKINRDFGDHVFGNFVSNYRMLGSVYQMFNTPPSRVKDVVQLQESVAAQMISSAEREKQKLDPVDKITYNVYIKKFNEKFNDMLTPRQKNLMKEYIYSVGDGGLSFKMHISEEMQNIQKSLSHIVESRDDIPTERIKKVLEKLETFKEKPLNEKMIKDVMLMQELLEELEENDKD